MILADSLKVHDKLQNRCESFLLTRSGLNRFSFPLFPFLWIGPLTLIMSLSSRPPKARWISWILALSITGAVFAVYSGTLLNTYGFTDDFFIEKLCAEPGFTFLTNRFHHEGRFLMGVLALVVFDELPRIEDFTWIRLIGVSGIAALGIAMQALLRSRGWSLPSSTAAALLFCFSPPLALFAGWAITFPYSWASLLALLAGFLQLRKLEETGSALRFRALGGSAILLVSLHLYQPCSGLFLLPALLQALNPEIDSIRWKRWLQIVGLYFGVLVLYFLLYKAVAWGVLGPHRDFDRVHFADSPLERLEFLLQTIQRATLSWTLWEPLAAQIAVAALLVIGIAGAVVTRSRREITIGVGILGVTVVLASLPLYLSNEEQLNFRGFISLFAILPTVALAGWDRLAHRNRAGTVLWTTILLLLTIGTGWTARFRLHQGIIRPASEEYRVFTNWIDENLTEAPVGILYQFAPPSQLAITRQEVIADFGYRWAGWPYIHLSPLPQMIWEKFGNPELPFAQQVGHPRIGVYPIRTIDDPDDFRPLPLLDGTQLFEIDSTQPARPGVWMLQCPVLGEVEYGHYGFFIYSSIIGPCYLENVSWVSSWSWQIINGAEVLLGWSPVLGKFAADRVEDGKLRINSDICGIGTILSSGAHDWIVRTAEGTERWHFAPDGKVHSELLTPIEAE